MASNASTSGTGFVNLQQYVNANQGTLNGMANTLSDIDTANAQKAMTEDNNVGQVGFNLAKSQGPNDTFDPTQLGGYATAQQMSNDAYQQLQGLTNGGLQSQLQHWYGMQIPAQEHGYGQGDSSFDAALLGGSGQAQNTFHNAQNQFKDLNTYLDTNLQSQVNAGNKAYVPPMPAPTPPATQPSGTGVTNSPGQPYIKPTVGGGNRPVPKKPQYP